MGGRRGYRRLVDIDNGNNSAPILTAIETGPVDFLFRYPRLALRIVGAAEGPISLLRTLEAGLFFKLSRVHTSPISLLRRLETLSAGSFTFSSYGCYQISLRMVFIISRRALASGVATT